MSTTQVDENNLEQAHEAFTADMKTRIEQAKASGQSPEQIQEMVTAYAREEMRRKIPQVVTKVRSWWIGFRRFVIVGALALGFATGLALYVEHYYAAPLCEHYANQHELVYRGVYYPVIGNSSSTTSFGSCIFYDAAGHKDTVLLHKLEPNQLIALLVSFALQIDVITPAAFIFIALIAVKLFKIK